MRSIDLFVLCGLVRHQPGDGWTVRSLAAELHLPQAAVQRSLVRLDETPVFSVASRRLDLSVAEELIRHSVPFVAPGKLGAPTRGVPTAWAARPLSDVIVADELPPVWPAADGEVRGLALGPLHPAAIQLSRADPWMYEMLALIDGLRVGDARVRSSAREFLDERFETVLR